MEMSSLKIGLLFLLFSKPNIDRPQQAVSAAIIQNSAIYWKLFPQHRVAKDKIGSLFICSFPANLESKLL
jgi:hypothetical protein